MTSLSKNGLLGSRRNKKFAERFAKIGAGAKPIARAERAAAGGGTFIEAGPAKSPAVASKSENRPSVSNGSARKSASATAAQSSSSGIYQAPARPGEPGFGWGGGWCCRAGRCKGLRWTIPVRRPAICKVAICGYRICGYRVSGLSRPGHACRAHACRARSCRARSCRTLGGGRRFGGACWRW